MLDFIAPIANIFSEVCNIEQIADKPHVKLTMGIQPKRVAEDVFFRGAEPNAIQTWTTQSCRLARSQPRPSNNRRVKKPATESATQS
jgi:hypothetical protein